MAPTIDSATPKSLKVAAMDSVIDRKMTCKIISNSIKQSRQQVQKYGNFR